MLRTSPPLSLYIHLPWCVRKCPYCDFNSHEIRGDIDEHGYVDALLRDLEYEAPRVAGRRFETIFLGGGTPSLFAPAAIARLLDGVRALTAVDEHAEITLEANPGTVEVERFRGYRSAGVNRLSIGIQSFAPDKLTALGRIHDRGQALRAADAARAAGFENFNLDLMYGLPGQTVAEAIDDLNTALAFRPPHMSAYQLTIEPNTEFYVRPPALPDDDTQWQMQQALEQSLAAAGFQHYEISAYARAGCACRHNLNYWRFGDYVGIGAGAHGKRSQPDGIMRSWKRKHPRDYVAHAGSAAAVGGEHRLSDAELVCEFMLNALRLADGFTPTLFSAHTGLAFSTIEQRLAHAHQRALIEYCNDCIRATSLGRRFLNELLLDFLPEERDRTLSATS